LRVRVFLGGKKIRKCNLQTTITNKQTKKKKRKKKRGVSYINEYPR